MKQETLEEFGTRELSNFNDNVRNSEFDLGFRTGTIIGLRFPKERMYSEEEAGELVYNIIGEYAKHYGIMIDGDKLNDLFKQFKNK